MRDTSTRVGAFEEGDSGGYALTRVLGPLDTS